MLDEADLAPALARLLDEARQARPHRERAAGRAGGQADALAAVQGSAPADPDRALRAGRASAGRRRRIGGRLHPRGSGRRQDAGYGRDGAQGRSAPPSRIARARRNQSDDRHVERACAGRTARTRAQWTRRRPSAGRSRPQLHLDGAARRRRDAAGDPHRGGRDSARPTAQRRRALRPSWAPCARPCSPTAPTTSSPNWC